MERGILNMAIAETPIAVIDFETTGLSPGYDRAVELSIVRVEPGGRNATLVLDTLINPRRRVAATDIHGITDAMVSGAPEFKDILPAVQSALSGCVVGAYNAYFDMRFLTAEAEQAGASMNLPYFCLMYLRSVIGVGSRCRLDVACQTHGVRLHDAHRSARDAMATAGLIPDYLTAMRTKGMETFGDLWRASSHKYLDSFRHEPIRAVAGSRSCGLWPREKAVTRRGVPSLVRAKR